MPSYYYATMPYMVLRMDFKRGMRIFKCVWSPELLWFQTAGGTVPELRSSGTRLQRVAWYIHIYKRERETESPLDCFTFILWSVYKGVAQGDSLGCTVVAI